MAYLTNTNVHNACNGKPEMNLTEVISPETDIQEVRILKIRLANTLHTDK